MFDDCDEGLDDDGFIDNLNQYVYDNHYDDKIDDIAKDWQLQSLYLESQNNQK